jgi:catechol 2,3-dioxygenase-like lactoylglutathione lyase family enzyme
MSTWDAQVVFLVTRDLEATTRFYVDGLGLPLALDQGTCRIFRVAPSAFLGFCRRDAAPNPDGVIVTLVTEDVDGWFDRLRTRGIAIEKAPTYNPAYKITHGFLRDPNGYLVEIQRFDDPMWRSPSS